MVTLAKIDDRALSWKSVPSHHKVPKKGDTILLLFMLNIHLGGNLYFVFLLRNISTVSFVKLCLDIEVIVHLVLMMLWMFHHINVMVVMLNVMIAVYIIKLEMDDTALTLRLPFCLSPLRNQSLS